GQALHRLLDWAGRPDAPLAPAQWKAAAAAAAAAFGLPEAATTVSDLAHRVLHSPACAPFFRGPRLRWAGNEVPLADAQGPLRIDRLVLLDDEAPPGRTWWVLDYKLHSAPAGLAPLRLQLQRYVAAVQALQPGDAVRGAFVTAGGELQPL
ncbi:MAG: DNA helicase UvrD, partial [Burkholderiales bacterium]|nr:DNA helicase UvrD [Burkholderiales bacterium]